MRIFPISAKAEYACLAMLELARRYEENVPVSLKAMTDSKAIPPRFLTLILLQLKGGGLVHSTRGPQGGYLLARPPKLISLADIVNAIDPYETSPAVRQPGNGSDNPSVDAIRDVWKEIHAAQRRVLEQISLAELMLRVREGSALAYQI